MEKPQRHRDTEPDEDINKITERIIGLINFNSSLLKDGVKRFAA